MLQPKSDTDRIYLSRQKGVRGLIGVTIYVRSAANNLTLCVKNAAEKCLTVVRRSDMLSNEEANEKNYFDQSVRKVPEDVNKMKT